MEINMGDRTYAAVTINRHYYDQNKSVIDEMGYELADKSEETVTFADDQSNYGNMDDIENFCQEHNIEYDKRWQAGDNYEAGEEHARIVKGILNVHTMSDSGFIVLQELKTILAETDPIKREALLKKKVKEHEPFEVTPLKGPNSIH